MLPQSNAPDVSGHNPQSGWPRFGIDPCSRNAFGLFELCERIYAQFRAGKLAISPKLKQRFNFELEYAPEPYLVISGGRDALLEDPCRFLHVVTTNPGGPLASNVQRGDSDLLKEKGKYWEAAEALLIHYKKNLITPKLQPALNRIKAMEALGNKMGKANCRGVIQLDIIPWRSMSNCCQV